MSQGLRDFQVDAEEGWHVVVKNTFLQAQQVGDAGSSNLRSRHRRSQSVPCEFSPAPASPNLRRSVSARSPPSSDSQTPPPLEKAQPLEQVTPPTSGGRRRQRGQGGAAERSRKRNLQISSSGSDASAEKPAPAAGDYRRRSQRSVASTPRKRNCPTPPSGSDSLSSAEKVPTPKSGRRRGQGGLGSASKCDRVQEATDVRPSSEEHHGSGSSSGDSADAAGPRGPRPSAGTWSEAAHQSDDAQGRTTLMLRNLPEQFMRKDLEELLETLEFKGDVDFVYLPSDIATGRTFEYAFVNLATPEAALRFIGHFQGFRAWTKPCEKEAGVHWSEALQGLDQLIERYRNSPLMHDSVPDFVKPALYSEGERMEFPPPTQPIKPPRTRRTGGRKTVGVQFASSEAD